MKYFAKGLAIAKLVYFIQLAFGSFIEK